MALHTEASTDIYWCLSCILVLVVGCFMLTIPPKCNLQQHRKQQCTFKTSLLAMTCFRAIMLALTSYWSPITWWGMHVRGFVYVVNLLALLEYTLHQAGSFLLIQDTGTLVTIYVLLLLCCCVFCTAVPEAINTNDDKKQLLQHHVPVFQAQIDHQQANKPRAAANELSMRTNTCV